jgi:hypothetical protein
MKTDALLLESRVRKNYEKGRSKQKEHYLLAKSLGFSAVEAVILQNWSEERIRALAKATKPCQE